MEGARIFFIQGVFHLAELVYVFKRVIGTFTFYINQSFVKNTMNLSERMHSPAYELIHHFISLCSIILSTTLHTKTWIYFK